MRWSEARYLPGDFDAFDAFDDAGNPPVYFWTRYLRIQVPVNWFSLFEEARRRQRMWTMDIQRHYLYQQQQEQQQDQEQQHDDEDDMLSFPAPPSSISSLPLNNNDINDKKQGEDKQTNNKSTVYPDNDPPSHNMGTSFSQLRHGVPLKPPSPTTAAAAAAFPSSYSTSSSFSVDPQPKNSNDRQSDTNDQHLIYSPAPSIQHATSNIATTSRTTTTTLLSDKGSNTPSSSREKNAAMDFLQTEYHPGHSTMTRCPSKTTRRSLSINLPTNKKQQHRKSVLGLF
ncbi:hypothetical protein BC941DRAFT_10053 [Chlamydoabsidia padenii]|nr:hypothetical protein BC941DRAFT_10053 [Chlamydoabsidia padenii]